MKKIFILSMTILMCNSARSNKNIIVAANALGPTNALTDLFDYRSYIKNYSSYENKTLIGKKYQGPLHDHRQVISYGDFYIKASEIEKITSNYQVGTILSPLKITDSTIYQIVNSITVTQQVKVGITQMAEATVKLENVASVGTKTSTTTEYTLTTQKYYSESLTKSRTIEQSWDLTKIPSDKKVFSISRVAIYYELAVKESYTQYYFFGWNKYSDTINTNYKIQYHLFDVVTFVYSDGTFGINGATYPLSLNIAL